MGDESLEIKIDRLERAINDRVLPLLEQHHQAIWGKDGNNGLSGGLREARTKINFLERAYFIVGAAAAGGLFTALFAIFTRR